MLLEKFDEKIDSWNKELSKEALRIVKDAEKETDSLYNSIMEKLVKSLKPFFEEGLFRSKYEIRFEDIKGEFSKTDIEFFKEKGIKSASIYICSVPLLMEKLEKEKAELEASGRGEMKYYQTGGSLCINIEFKSKEYLIQEETSKDSEFEKTEDNPKLERKATD